MDDQATTGTSGGVRFRKLRIAWSMAWGILAVLFCVLWVRSYSNQEGFLYRSNKTLASAFTSEGVAGGYYYSLPPDTVMGNPEGITWLSNPITPQVVTETLVWESSPQGLRILFPAGCYVGVILLLAAVVWLPVKRFSLRTLLIATTLVAVGLGLMIWAARIYRHFLP